MKFTAIILSFLYLQVSASFLDDFRSAIVNVERGFGKLLSDVVTDVEETIHCTISAVEQVLVLNGLLDKTSAYSYSCRDLSKPIQPIPLTPSKIRDQRSVFDRFNKKYPNLKLDHRNSSKHISTELRKSIANVNRTISEILDRRKINNNLQIVSKTMKDKTNRLTEISNILRRELENISSNIRQEIKKLNFDHHEPNVGSVWDEFKTLHDIQRSSKNTTEVNEIRNVLNEVVDKLHLNTGDTNDSGDFNLQEIRKILQTSSDSDNDKNIENDSYVDSVAKDLSFKKSEKEDELINFKDAAKTILNSKNMDIDNQIQKNTGKSIFSLESDSFDYFAPFAKTNTNYNKALNDAKKIIEDSQHADKVLNNLFSQQQSGYNIFSDPDPFNYNKS